MPLRGYRCECGTELEELFWNDYPRSLPCPKCGKKAVYRICDTHYEKLGDRQPKRYKVDFQAGYDLGAGRYFDKKSDRDRWLHETGTTRIKALE